MTNIKTTTRGIIFDCIGVSLILSRNYRHSFLVNELDKLCGQSLPKAVVLRRFSDKFNIKNIDLDIYWTHLINKYELNISIAEAISSLKYHAQIALFNEGCPDSFYEWVKIYNLVNIFNFVFNSYHLGFLKDDPRSFNKIAEEMGCSPQKCIVVDDQLANIASAQDSGFLGIHYQKNLFKKSSIFLDAIYSLFNLNNNNE